jgi:hypothetical protein
VHATASRNRRNEKQKRPFLERISHVANTGLAQPGEYVVIMGGLPIASQARTNFVKLHRIDLY